MKAYPFIALASAFLVALGSGCGGSGGGWYENTKKGDERKTSYIEQQMQHGMSEEDAKKAFGLQVAIEQTEGIEVPTAGTTTEFSP
jgi:hypothetical protein